MSTLVSVLVVIVLLILATSLIYTFKVGKLATSRKSELDTQINEKVQEHPYLRNPIFLAYLIGAMLVLAFIFYMAYSTS
ncbi:hypothetical protein ACFFIX_04505 [Metabacillus herbersteinensis]|uniref:Short-chain dehydrogenase n=1 Tax=Metabacillus herbersteinensis TaxID=283816 RepID=A0ABV6GBC2_9BACI